MKRGVVQKKPYSNAAMRIVCPIGTHDNRRPSPGGSSISGGYGFDVSTEAEHVDGEDCRQFLQAVLNPALSMGLRRSATVISLAVGFDRIRRNLMTTPIPAEPAMISRRSPARVSRGKRRPFFLLRQRASRMIALHRPPEKFRLYDRANEHVARRQRIQLGFCRRRAAGQYPDAKIRFEQIRQDNSSRCSYSP